MAQHALNQFSAGQGGSGVDPNDLAMSGTYTASYSNTFNGDNNASNGFIGDDELFDGLASPTDHMPNQGMHNHNQDFGMNDLNMGYQGIYTARHNGTGLHIDQSHMNGYSSTPDGDPIQSPFVHSYNQPQFRQMQHQPFANSLQSPVSYSGSPMTNSDMNNDGNDPNYLNAKPHPQLSQAMQRKASHTRGPLTPKAAAMSGMAMGPRDLRYGAQPIRTPGHQGKSPPAPQPQWINTPNSMGSYPGSGSGFSSPMQNAMPNQPITDVMTGRSMPAKLGAPPMNTQEAMKKKRRRESHNLVERRRRDNINERIQDLSRLVPTHRLEDEKIRKLIQNGTPLSPSLTGLSHPTQATSGLAGPGAKRATGAGNITTGLPLEEKDKGPNKGDILNGAVSWTRDLMWMLHLKLQQQEELINLIAELGGRVPLELTEDERRMQTELMEAMTKNGPHTFSYSRSSGSGLRVPQHTDYKGDPINGADHAITSVSPDDGELVGLDDGAQFWNDPEDDGSGPASINFKEEDEYGMDFSQD
ncbi:helix-loop-helix DNA-binding domain-containing protein [Camillea tinctor]|nr:helix-loop-helix DNA-binding domain-containing protein [Camillea tinctor]